MYNFYVKKRLAMKFTHFSI